jgi:hypothetical protein
MAVEQHQPPILAHQRQTSLVPLKRANRSAPSTSLQHAA